MVYHIQGADRLLGQVFMCKYLVAIGVKRSFHVLSMPVSTVVYGSFEKMIFVLYLRGIHYFTITLSHVEVYYCYVLISAMSFDVIVHSPTRASSNL